MAASAPAQAPAGAQATFKVRNNPAVQQGVVLGAGPTGVKIAIGAQSITLQPAMFEQFQMAPPPEYAAGYKAYTAHDYKTALAQIKSVTDKYKGLPTDWAQYATSLLGDIYVAMEDLPKAEAAYNDYKRVYPGAGSLQSEVGLARIAMAKKDYPTAKQKLEPITAAALKEKNITNANGPAYGHAFLASGELKEQDGNLPGALEDYLRTVTLFYHDRAAVLSAHERADALRAKSKGEPVTVP